MRLFIANISHKLDETDIKRLFATFGQVAAIMLATDPETGRRKGFGFVDMPVEVQALKAIQSLNGLEL